MKNLLLLICIAVFFTSCFNPRYAYSPTAHNVPNFTQKGDSKLAASYSTNGPGSQSNDGSSNQYSKNNSQGFDLQGAIAVTNNIGLQASYFYRSENTNSTYDYDFSSSSVKYKRNLLEFGAGYFTPMDTKKHVLFQAYAGGGFGKTTINDKGLTQNQDAYSRYYNADITKFYIEPSISFQPNKIFTATIATRASFVKFRNINSNYTLPEKQDFNLDSLDRFGVVFFEPAFIGSFGFNKLPGFRIEFQTGLSVLWESDFIYYRPFNFSIGLVADIRKLVKGPNN